MPGKRHLFFGFLCEELLSQIFESFSSVRLDLPITGRLQAGTKELPLIYPSVARQTLEQVKRTSKQ